MKALLDLVEILEKKVFWIERGTEEAKREFLKKLKLFGF